ncbi:unnamed protein product [Clonostachys rhizophaga]|uniref:Uncharacterized protein n=1 Tax=Clonostachys rhizophaga TaxID=160324 RepID=A0A9N9VMM8_9HYPO|nr:unnamed protein product [Clonostachys rhizophaga]
MASAPRLCLLPNESEARKARGMEDDAAGSGSGKAERPTLLSFKEMPEWFQQDNNQWILHGYRPISGSVRASFRSWWYLHNETVNIYSHLIPAVLFLLGEWYIMQHLSRKYARVTSTDLVAFSFFILPATICYAFSALYHTSMNYSYTIGVIGASTIITNINPKLQSHKYRSKRTLAFVATGISVVAPLIHGLDIFGLDLMSKKAFTCTIVAKIGCLLSGTSLYAIRFPESWWPGKFDMCSSHSFMHILVVCAAIIQMIGYLEAFDYAYSNITCPAS